MLQVDNIDVFYGDIQALHSLSIHVEDGEIVGVIGANGAGKSTMMNTISGILRPRSGSIVYSGEELTRRSTHDIVEMGVIQVPEGRRIFPGLTVRENLMVATAARNVSSSELRTDMDRVLSVFPTLADRLSQRGWSLSGGEQQMVAVGRGLMAHPEILLLDEPSLGLAPIVVERLFDTVVRIHEEEGLTILLVEQNAALALEIADRAYVMETGRIVGEGIADELRRDVAVKEAYLGG